MHQSVTRVLTLCCNAKGTTEVFHLDYVKHHAGQQERHKSA